MAVFNHKSKGSIIGSGIYVFRHYGDEGIILPTFTGSHAIFGDGKKGYIEMYSSGTLTLNSTAKYDVHLVGGGGGNVRQGYATSSSSYKYGGGGGGGFTTTAVKRSIEAGTYPIVIGSGGTGKNGYSLVSAVSGGTSSGMGLSAEGGWRGYTGNTKYANEGSASGGKGGSGGGGNIRGTVGDGGSDGSSGTSTGAGTGQGTTTKDFGTGTLRAGGGGGSHYYDNDDGKSSLVKGDGGAGGGGTYAAAGVANTGGGAGGCATALYSGGSGIVIVRWGY